MRYWVLILVAFFLAGCGRETIRSSSSAVPSSAKGGLSVIFNPGLTIKSVLNYVVDPKISNANTGIAYDSKRNQILHADYNFDDATNFLIVTDIENKEFRRIDITSLIKFAQGIAYEKERDAIWIWGTRVNSVFKEYTDCFDLVVIDQTGKEIERFSTPVIDGYPGMIALVDRNHVWLKANGQPIARFYDVRTFKLEKEIDTGVGGEGVAVDQSNGLWSHGGRWVEGREIADECLLSRTDLVTGKIDSVVSPSPRCGAEGLVFDGDNRLWLTTDDGHHFDLQDGNQAWVVSFL